MPIFDFVCQDCSTEFEALIRGSAVAKCPKCGSEKLERQLSMPNMKTSGTTALAMAAAKRRDKKQGDERVHTQREYEKSHDSD
ncbi:MAG: zinc ribbon domain-containing protein [Gemmatimonadaceae bacterium]